MLLTFGGDSWYNAVNRFFGGVFMASEAQKKAVRKYRAAHYDRLEVQIKSGGRDLLKDHCAARDKSVNSFILRAIRYALADDGADAETIRKICGD
jgi:hypothetical protein